MKRPAVFFDRDNTLIVNDGYLGDPDGVVLVDGAAELVARVRRLGYAAVTFSNQSGVARGLFTEQDVHRVNSRLDELLRDQDPDAIIDRHEFCPHHPEAEVPRYRQASEFRKPAPGMIYQAARQLELDLSRSWVVGDAPRDIEAGRAAGCRTILFKATSLAQSSSAKEPASVEPDFVAASLAEAADLINNNPPAEEPAQPVGGALLTENTERDVAAEITSGQIAVESPVENEGASLEIGPAAAGGTVLKEPPESSETGSDGRASEPAERDQMPDAAGEAVISNAPIPGQGSPPQPADEEDMEDRSATGPAESSGAESDGATPRRSPPAVILAAKAARAAARNSVPDASPEVLREVARNAAREAAMGITRDYAAAAPAAASDATPHYVSAAVAPPEPQEAASDPATEPSAESDSPAHHDTPPEYSEPRTAPAANLSRLEDLAEQILMELRQRNEVGGDFSVSKLMAGITMVISLAVLGYAYLYKNEPTTVQGLLLLGLMLQAITISLLIMGRQK